jgi:PucR family transcriptional regulator, purine catabolism regulatory protein
LSEQDKEVGRMSVVTVRDVLTLTVLQESYVVGGRRGLDRRVSGVNVMEVPDIEAYVKPGELLLTTAYPVRDRPERLVELVPELHRRGLAALGIKPLRYLAGLPDGLAEVADRLAFPVLVLADDMSFNDVIGAVLAVVLAEYGAEPGRAEAIRERLTGVALAGGGLEEIARTLAGALERDVTVVDEHGVALGSGTQTGGTAVAVGEPLEDRGAGWEFPVTVGGARRGCIVVSGPQEPTLGQRRLIRQACFAAGMHIAQALAGLELDRRMRVLFLEELVTASSADEPLVRQRSRLFGWDLGGDHAVLLGQCTVELPDSGIEAAAASCLPPGSLAWSRGTEVVAVVPVIRTPRDPDLDPVAATWQSALTRLQGHASVVAAGSIAHGPAKLATSHAAAREALVIAKATGRRVVAYDELLLERLLLTVPRTSLEEYAAQVLDGLGDPDLCATLDAYLGVGNAAEAARRLFIHYNTMKHRLARIADVTGADLHDPRTRLTLALALEVRKLLSAQGPAGAGPPT